MVLADNLELSQRRAQALVAWLKNEGEAQPVADNASEVGRRLNRRVEVRSLTK